MNKGGTDQNKYFQANSAMHLLRLIVCPTTGGQFQLSVSPRESVIGLKSTLAKKLKLRADRMSLLHRDRLLVHGTLLDNHLGNGSQLTLVPNMETGTASVCTDSRVMQALENLSESQVNDFLTGRAPLFLAMKLGEHMMFVQLQLSATSCNARRRHAHPPPTPPHAHTHTCHPGGGSSLAPEKSRCSCSHGPNAGTSGAVIDSVNHLGHGVYSGTFSGTLDPSVQSPMGKPKRDITTILQILNDLLMASPQFRQSAYTCPNYATKRFSGEQRSHVLAGPDDASALPQSTYLDNGENSSLRGKVQTLKRMMQERKMRRQGKRCLRAPYHWPSRQFATSQSSYKMSHMKYDTAAMGRERELGTKSETLAPAADASFPATSTMEQESVLV